MAFDEALSYLEGLGIDAMKATSPSLHRIRALCDSMGNPEKTLRCIHITGTNGKTSTARLASSLLAATGLSVGTYTSPHLESMCERIARAEDPISESEFGEVFAHLRPFLELVEKRLDEKLTYFEVLTGLFFLWAAEAGLDAAVVEVGLGGRWDATNVIDSSVAVITNIGLDHTALLGGDKKVIAKEKAGIIKEDSVTVSAERTPEIVEVIRAEALRVGAEVSFMNDGWELLENSVAVGGRFLSIRASFDEYEGLLLPLHGAHQGVNAALALEAVGRFLPARGLAQELVQQGLSGAVVPGRLEAVRSDGTVYPTVVLDVAHNPDGVSALVRSLIEEFAFDRVHFVVGVLQDKDHRGMLAELSRVPCTVTTTTPRGVRAIEASELTSTGRELGLECETVDDPTEAITRAVHNAGPGEIVCVTGSHYVVGEIRRTVIAAAGKVSP
ncbi:MAG: bifunctional folylpolyglutamate synthase/dihydrofolate synthase [Actinomycetota bacterium]|nr:bifunctional folylpolyglutamate synthase/dihydrofolate synthase [Actinomycetota bacterium]